MKIYDDFKSRQQRMLIAEDKHELKRLIITEFFSKLEIDIFENVLSLVEIPCVRYHWSMISAISFNIQIAHKYHIRYNSIL